MGDSYVASRVFLRWSAFAHLCPTWQGLPVAIVAVAWMAFSVVILAFPTAPGPTADGMNYMIVVFGGWIALCLVYYHLPVYGGACWFNGPQITLEDAAGAGVVIRSEEEVEKVGQFMGSDEKMKA